MKKYCNFCGEPMQAEAKECKQCGWDVSHNGPPSTDPGDSKARLGVAAGLVVAYGVMWFLIQGTPAPARAVEAPRRTAVVEEPVDYEPVPQQAVAIGTVPAGATIPATVTKPSALLNIKVADTKSSVVGARDALQYPFEVPETDQKCRLVGATKGVGGFGGSIEVFLLTDDEYVFWNANRAAIANSSWETFRGSENTLNYELPGPGIYHFIVSNAMSPTPQSIAVQARVRCTR